MSRRGNGEGLASDLKRTGESEWKLLVRGASLGHARDKRGAGPSMSTGATQPEPHSKGAYEYLRGHFLRSGAYHSCPLRGFTQQLTETDAETLSQTIAVVVFGEELRDPWRTVFSQEEQQSQITWTLGGSQILKHQGKSNYGLDLGPLHSKYPSWSSRVPQQLELGLFLILLPACRPYSSNGPA